MIEVHIPYLPDYRLCDAYNYYMERAGSEWVLFLDHDVYLALNEKWYEICKQAIERVNDKAGILTCRTNRMSEKTAAYRYLCYPEHFYTGGGEDNIEHHRRLAKATYEKWGSQVEKIPPFIVNLPGFFFLTNKTAWKAIGGFVPHPKRKEGIRNFLGVDNSYSSRLLDAGFFHYCMLGLYVYHGYFRDWRKP